MSKTYKYAGLTKELHQRLVNERVALKEAHAKDYKQFFQDVRQCSEAQARNIYQKFNSVVVGRLKLSPKTANELKGIISDGLFNDIQSYLDKHYTRGTITRPEVDRTNAGLPEDLYKRFRAEVEALRANHKTDITKYIMSIKGCTKKEANKIRDSINRCYVEDITLGPLKVIQMEGLLSRELLGDMARYVFNKYEWPDRLDSEVDRIVLEYRTKGELGRNKATVRKALYTAYALGV
nr:MAG TPA: Protein of unknown function (DUF1340) [Caudoviricetes sp.]